VPKRQKMPKKPLQGRIPEEDYDFAMKYGKKETEALENMIQRLKALEQNQPQQPQSDIPITDLSLQQRAETNPALKDLLEACKRDDERQLARTAFPCSLLCKKARGCLSHSMGVKDEIARSKCYEPRYPYEWTDPQGTYHRLCPWMSFARGVPNDVDNPYPTCIAKSKDVPIQQPKDRIMRNPENCWTCYLQRKAEFTKHYIKEDPFKGQPRVDYSSIESFDTFSLGDTR